jgi:hypothetical protein
VVHAGTVLVESVCLVLLLAGAGAKAGAASDSVVEALVIYNSLQTESL